MSPSFLQTPYALVDAARAGAHTDRLCRMAAGSRCLFRGESEIKLRSVAPHLLKLDTPGSLRNPLLESGWGDAWFVLVKAHSSFETLWRHFRRFLIVTAEDGRELYFRFYDPRVLRMILPVFDSAQLTDFFGPVEEFVVEDDDPAFCLRFSLQNRMLKTERLPVK